MCMVIEYNDENGMWHAILACKVPEEIDDALKGTFLSTAEKWKEDLVKKAQTAKAFNRVSGKLSSQEVYTLMPCRLPQTYHLKIDGTVV